MKTNQLTDHKSPIVRFIGREIFWFLWLYMLPVLIVLIFMGSYTLISNESLFGNKDTLEVVGLFFGIPLFYWGIIYLFITPFRWIITAWKYFYDKKYDKMLKLNEPHDNISSFSGIEYNHPLKNDAEDRAS